MRIKDGDDPETRLQSVLHQRSEDDNIDFRVTVVRCDGINQLDKILKALTRLDKPRWRLALCLGCNKLRTVPVSIRKLLNLEELILSDNKLETISIVIAELVKLKTLWIYGNPFKRFPEAVCKLEQLEDLDVTRCQLSGLPSSFASLRNLLELHLGDNAFEQFPEVVCELRSLRKLRLGGNDLSSLPRSFANLRELTHLWLAFNCFKEFPVVICELLNLESLDFSGNGLHELPLAITKLVRLQYLHLSGNFFTSFPLFLGDLSRLTFFASFCKFNRSVRFTCLQLVAANPVRGPQRDILVMDLIDFLQQHKERVRLSAIITGGFCALNDTNPWTRFLVRGLYDPRLLLVIADFAIDTYELARKRGRYEPVQAEPDSD